MAVAFGQWAVADKLVTKAPGFEVGSRWRGERTWNPVTSHVRIEWPACPLPNWPVQKLWCEVFLERDWNPHRLRLRTGPLVEGRVAVQRWYGKLLEVSAATFPGRHGQWTWRGRYGESWAYREFRATEPDHMTSEVVEDLVSWVTLVLPGLARA